MSFLPLLMAQSVRAQEQQKEPTVITTIKRLSEIERPATNVSELFSQSSTPSSEVVQVTAVKANPTAKGVEVILQTTKGEQLQITNRSAGNSFIADIPNAQLRLPSGEAFTFRSEKPLAGVTEITVTNFDANTIRVTAIGEASSPTVELFDSDEGLIFGLTTAASIAQQQPQTQPTPQVEQPTNQTQPQQPPASSDEPIELVVTGEQDGYSVPDASTATKTDTPLRDIPQSIQVVPQQVLRDQQVTRLNDALRNVPGVITTLGTPGNSEGSSFTIRGFDSGTTLRNGLADPVGDRSLELSNIERVEVLKGPASALFGNGSPGGTVNLITKQPLATPYYAVEATVGSYSYYRGAVDLSGPLNDDKTGLYRLNVSYKDAGSFIDFAHDKNLLIAPVFSFAIGERTKLTLEGEYISADTNRLWLPAIGTVLPNQNGKIRRNLNISGPDRNDNYVHEDIGRIGYSLEHKFSDNWSLKNAFRAIFYHFETSALLPTSLDPDNRTLNRIFNQGQFDDEAYNLATDIIGKFSTGSIKHQLLFGFDLSRFSYESLFNNRNAAPINLFNPVYDRFLGESLGLQNNSSLTDALGIYIQDQISLSENLKLLLGVRFDAFKQTDGDLLANTESSQSGDAFSPRFGIVYQPLPPISLYASYSRSFTPVIGTSFDRSTFEPERATQYEVGVKADLNERISTTLAFYNLTRSNVLTEDPNYPGQDYSIQTGEQRSRGIEFNIGGEILPGLNVIAGYAYTDAKITEDETYTPGNYLNNVPKNSFNLWTKYEIQSGSLKGLGLGLGLFYVGDRQADLENSFELPSYFRTDAAIFYKQGQLRAQVNFRNLFDVDYFESARNILRVYPGEPFTVQGTISWEL
ncbi:TonB-dependent siderophore receptor [Nostoc sp. 'Peltigera membranacea cyanobiont' 213]|nr:TonB-dependent siderophore receptor [Nostoc sp. 'Peltigera membranacea cyanobiont' 213]